MGWPSIQGYQNGTDKVEASVLNRPLNQLAERTEYLRRLIQDNDRTKVAVVDATVSDPVNLSDPVYPEAGQPVYRCPNGSYARAAALVGENAWFYADPQAMAVGVVSRRAGTSATVVLYGYLAFSGGIDAETVIVDERPSSGRYYLSTTYGKLTSSPSGPIIYVCDCQIVKIGSTYKVMSMLVNPQYRDTGESHVHRSFVISGSPLGGYSVSTGGRYWVPDIVSGDAAKSTTALPTGMTVRPCGYWAHDTPVTYTLQVVRKSSAAETSTDWGDYDLSWSSNGQDGSGTAAISFTDNVTGRIAIGSHGLSVRLAITSGTLPASLVGTSKVWTLAMPDAAQAWLNYSEAGNPVGFQLNLGMYPELSRYVPPLPENGAALTVDGIDIRGVIFKERKQWRIRPADEDGGPWLTWYGGVDDGSVSAVCPFIYDADITKQKARDLVFHANRMRVGPTGFVTSLQPAEGSPLKITSAQTGADAVQGALQISMDIDFTSEASNVEGFQVVKAIDGTTFKTGPVVERVIAGPGLAVNREQGSVTVSVSNAVYAGDFETIALRNAKQDLAGGVFPYTKLLGWASGGTSNVNSGFTAKFRVPDHIPYTEHGYYVVVSASVFGEVASASTSVASFTLTNFMLADQACSPGASTSGVPSFDGKISAPVQGKTATIGVSFDGAYSEYDPVLIHGFAKEKTPGVVTPGTIILPDVKQRKSIGDLWLKDNTAGGGQPLVVWPGYFVGLDIARCATTGTEYVSPIGFLSLRWNLVEIP